MVSRCGTRFAVVHDAVWTRGVPATIVYDFEDDAELGHGFTLVLDRERSDDETNMNEYALVCMHCLIDEHPDVGRAIDESHSPRSVAFLPPIPKGGVSAYTRPAPPRTQPAAR
jgi:hypothetical protein